MVWRARGWSRSRTATASRPSTRAANPLRIRRHSRASGGARYGAALASGHLDNDPYADLAVGVPGQDFGSRTDAGAVVVYFGSPEGLDEDEPGVLVQGDLPNTGAAESGDRFGTALDIEDGVLLVGAPGEDIGANADAGAAVLYRFAEDGSVRGSSLSQSGVTPGAPEPGDGFGSAVAMGPGGMVIGVPGEDVGRVRDAGAVVTLPKTGVGTVFSQDSAGMGGSAEPGDRFGSALAYLFDLEETAPRVAIGVPGEDIGLLANAGAINFIESSSGTTPLRARSGVLTQNTRGVPGVAEAGDRFGSILARWEALHTSDLLVGIPDEDLGDVKDAGAAAKLHICCTDYA